MDPMTDDVNTGSNETQPQSKYIQQPDSNKNTNKSKQLRQQSAAYGRATPHNDSKNKLRCKSAVNHPMPASAVDKRKERQSRINSAPPLIADVRNRRLCETSAEQLSKTDDQAETSNEQKGMKLTRPQYLQYIKSSTGVVEEDFFAEIYPETAECEKKETR